MGKLLLVGTPIGNLGDMSPRGLEALKSADFIAAEDTRVTLKLLNHFGIKKPMLSYHQHNSQEMGQKIAHRLLEGESCALVTDAGMPCISDPGEALVALCGELGIQVVAVPGPTAVATALALSGLATGRFCFEGFLSVQKNSRMSHLQSIREEERTLVFYEAPHKLLYTLRDMLSVLGDRRIVLARELTKLHEETVRTTLSQAVERYGETPPRGEFVLVVEGAPPRVEEQIPLDEAVSMVRALQQEGVSASQAAKQVAKETGHRKGELYKAALDSAPGQE